MTWSRDLDAAPVGVDLEARLSNWDPSYSPIRTQAYLYKGEKRFRGIWEYGDVYLLWRLAEKTDSDT